MLRSLVCAGEMGRWLQKREQEIPGEHSDGNHLDHSRDGQQWPQRGSVRFVSADFRGNPTYSGWLRASAPEDQERLATEMIRPHDLRIVNFSGEQEPESGSANCLHGLAAMHRQPLP